LGRSVVNRYSVGATHGGCLTILEKHGSVHRVFRAPDL
jgi:hypothetical protein